ncbi:AmmeMemoRadiSam system protein B [bacterium CPR1]|nr:AmmeMemoRadiSam system protein B [bacterium CPR1]
MHLVSLRPLEPVPIDHEGERLIAFRDSAGLVSGVVMVRPAAYVLVSLLDGTRTKQEALAEFAVRTGARVDLATLDALIEQLEQALIMDGPRARQALASMSERPAAHAGSAYPAEADELAQFLEALLARERPSEPPAPLSGLLTPHIDLRRGAESYAMAYNSLINGLGENDTFVILGISHAPCRQPFILTRKPFETPFGYLQPDLDLIEELVQGCDFDPFQDEYNHLGEHSVEFQNGDSVSPGIGGTAGEAPVAIRKRSARRARPPPFGTPSFLAALKSAVQRRPGRVCLIAGADLAHKGVRFGEPPLDRDFLSQLELADLESLRYCEQGDYDAFFATHQADRGERNYCGTSAIYTMLHCLGGQPGVLHRYQQCNEPGVVSTVTVAAASYYRLPE